MDRNTIQLIARHTWQRTFSGKVIYALIAVIYLLIAYALITGWENYHTQNEIKALYHEEAYRDFVNNPDKHPHRMAHYGHYAFREAVPLSVFDRGLGSFMGNSIYLEAHVQNSANFSDAGLSTGLLRFGEISMAMIMQLLLPLFIFFIGFDTITSDRENGTLKILFGQGVGWSSLIAGRSAGLLAIILTMMVPAFISYLLIIVVNEPSAVTVQFLIRVLLLSLSYLAYFTLCCFFTVWISACCRSSKTSLVSLIGMWLVFAILLPRSVQSLGTLLFPIPTKSAFIKDLEQDVLKEGDSHNPNDPHYKALKDSLLQAYHVDSVEQLPFNYGGFQSQEGERISARIYARHYNKLQSAYKQQNLLMKFLSIADPYVAIRNLSMAISGTDYSSYSNFQQQAEDYRFAFVSKMNEFHMKDIDEGAHSAKLESDHGRWSEVKPFKPNEQTLLQAISQEMLPVLSIVLWVVAASLFTTVFTLKLNVL